MMHKLLVNEKLVMMNTLDCPGAISQRSQLVPCHQYNNLEDGSEKTLTAPAFSDFVGLPRREACSSNLL
jgi:hypothetical protein